MIIFSEDHLIPTDVNMLTISGKTSGYYYIHRALYDQAVILDDLYGEEKNMLIRAITGSEESREDVERFFEEVPAPMNIFGAFLLLVKQPLDDLLDMIGAIHVMSGPMNFRKMIQVPFEIRNSIPKFSLSIKEEYKLAWDRFMRTTMPYSEDIFMPGARVVVDAEAQDVNPLSGVTTTTHAAIDFSALGAEGATAEDLPEMDDQTVDAFWDNFDLSVFDEDEDEDEEEESAPAPAPAPASEPVAPSPAAQAVPPVPTQVVPEPEPEPKKEPKKELSFVDALLAGDL